MRSLGLNGLILVFLSAAAAILLWPADNSLTSTILGILIGASITLGSDILKGALAQRERLKALATLVYLDLGAAYARLERNILTHQVDMDLWDKVQVDLARSDLPPTSMLNLIALYHTGRKWNGHARALEMATTPEYAQHHREELERMAPGFTNAIKVILALLEPYIPRDFRSKLENPR